ncbi:MAG: hypothetical protein AB8B72_04320 [Crocinitomicaceae bacterium]
MKRITLALTIALAGLSFASCKKYGCTDPDAINFEDKVRSDNLLCEYEGSILFWYDEIVRDSLLQVLGPIESLEYYVEYVRADSLEFDNELVEPPVCGQPEVATYTSTMKTGFQRWVRYQIYTNFDALIYDSVVQLQANQCMKIRLD